ncbi:MAG TPA: xanthine dehydrogenase family protein molybdopterin-binding subunit [Bryobacteraceae bacterium]|jgi:CO/xanthine dehydrogenase Mo-binding subunit|nr:xanthine dehydrogenase family protein molybdopterin-binding subunit [Bryobacteraceae bacterium]
MESRVVGQPVQRKEVLGKLTGAAQYVDDLHPPGMLHGATIRSTIPRGRIQSVAFEPGVPWDEFVIVTSDDVPGTNVVSLIDDDQPFLASAVVNHPHEPILLLAHENKDLLRKARQLVRITYHPLPPIFDMDEARQAGVLIWGKDNVFKRYLVDKGNVDRVWPDAAYIVEGEYSTGAQEHVYIEPNGILASASAEDGVTVSGSLQCPYYVHKALMNLFGLPAERVRVIQQETGGAFGGKEEYPSMIAGHAALLAWKSGRPVKIVYDREEDMAATTKRHPSRTRHRTAVSRDGRLLAMDIEFTIDGGAYSTLSPVVLSRGTIHAAGPYRCPNVRIRSTAVATNAPPHGAFRGFGAPQSLFALERHMDKVAHAIGLAPDEFRRRNLLQTGDTTATGQVITQPLDLAGLQQRALEAAEYHRKIDEFRSANTDSPRRKGIGFATFMHGAGFTGSGERHLQSVVELEAAEDGGVRILCSMTEMGQGTNTILTQIAAEALGIPYEKVEICRPDTALVPNSGPTVASRTSMIVGKLIERAAYELKQKLRTGESPFRTRAQYEEPPGIHWDDQKYEGDAYGAYSWATYVAEVTVDTLTGEVQVDNFTAVQEVGRVLNPVLAAGQIEGGVVQALGFALFEKVVWRDGSMANSQLTNYIIPTAVDVPPIQVRFEEVPYQHGAMGAKGIGELPMDGPAPAVLNAVENALGIAFDRLPLSPEDVLNRLHDHVPEPVASLV